MSEQRSRSQDSRLGLRLKRRKYHGAERRRRRRGVPPGALSNGAAEQGISEQAEALLERQQDQMLRIKAEFENYRKRAKRDREEFRKTAAMDLIREILPILDNFSRALENPGSSLEGFVQGITMISSQFEGLLKESGLERIEAAGQAFDPNLHEAVSVDSSGEHPENSIVEVLQEGFRVGGKLLRPAMVRVARSE